MMEAETWHGWYLCGTAFIVSNPNDVAATNAWFESLLTLDQILGFATDDCVTM